MNALRPPYVNVEQQVANPFPTSRLGFDFGLEQPKNMRSDITRKPLRCKQSSKRAACLEMKGSVSKILPILDFRCLERSGLFVRELLKNGDNCLSEKILAKALVQEFAADAGIAALKIEIDHELVEDAVA